MAFKLLSSIFSFIGLLIVVLGSVSSFPSTFFSSFFFFFLFFCFLFFSSSLLLFIALLFWLFLFLFWLLSLASLITISYSSIGVFLIGFAKSIFNFSLLSEEKKYSAFFKIFWISSCWDWKDLRLFWGFWENCVEFEINDTAFKNDFGWVVSFERIMSISLELFSKPNIASNSSISISSAISLLFYIKLNLYLNICDYINF